MSYVCYSINIINCEQLGIINIIYYIVQASSVGYITSVALYIKHIIMQSMIL
jgi:hypothetical protein